MKLKYLLFAIILFSCLFLSSTTSLALIPGDFGSAGGGPPDGCVDFEDLMIFAMAYGSTPADLNWNPLCDVYPDDKIDFEDLMIFAMHYGQRDVFTKITVANEYINTTTGVTYVKGSDIVTVTFPESVGPDYIVEVAQKVWTADVITYEDKKVATPNIDRTIWNVNYDFTAYECEAICIVALVKHPCCPGEEVALRVVTVDYTKPYADLFVTVKDCDDLIVTGAYFEWTSRVTTDCCGDDCSGFACWSIVIDPDLYLGPCDTVVGIGCPVEGAIECGCLVYADSGETVCYYVDLYFEDNVGNAVGSTWVLTFDSDSLVSFNVDNTPIMAFDGIYQVLDGGCE